MSKTKHDVANALPEVEVEAAGFAHGLRLLLLAIARTNPSVGALLDEFTAMHADYLAELQTLARDSDDYLPVLEQFTRSARLIYKRLSELDTEQSAALRALPQYPSESALIH